jgi:hypothetical protein
VSLEQRLPLGVLTPRDRVVVPGGAIGLHDDVFVRPAEVRDHASAAEYERPVHLGTREPSIEDEVENHVLELAAGWRRARQHVIESGGTASRPEPPRRSNQLPNADPAQPERPPDRRAKDLLVDGRGEVDQCPCRGGDRNPVVPHDVLPLQRRGAVDANAGAMADSLARNGHLGMAPIPLEEPPKSGGGEVAEHGASAEALHGSEESPLQRDPGVADGVDAPVQRMQPALPDPDQDEITRQPALGQLRE